MFDNVDRIEKKLGGNVGPDGIMYSLRLARAAERFFVISLVLLVIVFVEAVAIVIMLPLKTTEVKYVEFTRSQDNSFVVYPSKLPKETATLLIRKALRDYIFLRNRRDWITDAERTAKMYAMSSDLVKVQFYKEMEVVKREMKDVDRDIEIISDSSLGQGVHQIEFETKDSKGDYAVKKLWLATIKYSIKPREVNGGNELVNPLGIFVEQYSVSERTRGD